MLLHLIMKLGVNKRYWYLPQENSENENSERTKRRTDIRNLYNLTGIFDLENINGTKMEFSSVKIQNWLDEKACLNLITQAGNEIVFKMFFFLWKTKKKKSRQGISRFDRLCFVRVKFFLYASFIHDTCEIIFCFLSPLHPIHNFALLYWRVFHIVIENLSVGNGFPSSSSNKKSFFSITEHRFFLVKTFLIHIIFFN